jgi:signal peptidase II
MKRPHIVYLLVSITLVVLVDQLTKFWVTQWVPLNSVGWSLGDGFLRLIHVRNLGVAFSFGHTFPDLLRGFLFILLPLGFLGYLLFLLLKGDLLWRDARFPWLNQGALVLIIGGGLGNLMDRIFREGVVDFIDVRFYGLFGLERWPTFNVADSCVFLGAGLWLVSSFVFSKSQKDSL